eukprot:TRINITY_DN67226_c0_g1_i1.p2 TRINITY_DN67226_c0_g1~~TRINITY_DN67226_c0_g1_i1.p2  ORF type:complete len:202 (+),score=56.71 TRINITY_DN67226_c0_g1_i1:77-682(+)
MSEGGVRFLEDSKLGLFRVDSDGVKHHVSAAELSEMRREIDGALREYRALITEQGNELAAVQARARSSRWNVGFCAAGTALGAAWTAHAYRAADPGDLSQHVFNSRVFRGRANPTLSTAGLRPFLRGQHMLRLLQNRPVVGIVCTVLAGERTLSAWRYRRLALRRSAAEEEQLNGFLQEQSRLSSLSNKLLRVSEHPVYRA